jgi:hypothetical protein
MKIEVRFCNLESLEALREHALRRIHFQLSRFGREIHSVTACLSELNGPKGGRAKRCCIRLRGPALEAISIDERSSDAFSAVDIAVERAAHSAGRALEKVRAGRRNGAVLGRVS